MSDASLPATPAPTSPSLWQRLSAWIDDRLNPILVREVHQALAARGFLSTAVLALLSVIVIALGVAGQDEVGPREGSEAFVLTLRVLAPILLFIVPFQAFQSMRAEVGGGTVEHLLTSRLSPSAIVRGKLWAATVQFMLYLSIFAPLVGMTYLLRGVDIPTIIVMLSIAVVMGLCACAVGIACGALARWSAFFRVVPFGIMLLGLGWLTVMAMAAMPFIVYDVRGAVGVERGLHWFATVALPAGALTLLCGMVGTATLAHRYENRSTMFRVYAVCLALSVFAYVLYQEGVGSDGDFAWSHLHGQSGLTETLTRTAALLALPLFLFTFFASTETPPLSPRMRQRVPRNELLATLSTPFLPGAGRGLLFTLLLGALVLLLPGLLGGWLEGGRAGSYESESALLAWLYIALFAALGTFVRARLAPTDQRTWQARGIMPALILLGILLPLLVRVIGGLRASARWAPWDALNPLHTFWSYRRHFGSRPGIWVTMGVLVGVLFLLTLPRIVAGIREVLRASRERKHRAG